MDPKQFTRVTKCFFLAKLGGEHTMFRCTPGNFLPFYIFIKIYVKCIFL
jgi:hypothetical protein